MEEVVKIEKAVEQKLVEEVEAMRCFCLGWSLQIVRKDHQIPQPKLEVEKKSDDTSAVPCAPTTV